MSSRRYHGPHSPDAPPEAGEPRAANRFRNRPARQVSGRARLLYLASLPMLIAGIGEIRRGDAPGMLVELGAFVLFLAAAALVNEGQRAEEAYNARSVAKPPAIPRKILGSVAAGLGVALGAGFGWGLGLASGLIFGAVAAGAGIVAFGPDPLRAKGMKADDFHGARAAEALERAETLLREMTAAAARFGDRALEGRVERVVSAARDVFAEVEADPRDLDRARKFLGVYLTGARDATVRFAELWSRSRDTKARADYEALLGDLEASFTARRRELLAEDRGTLDIEIEVLRKRLAQEGLG
ncbi:5-bromo-4-chloroindolyl phosphate hydrolysis family protein [Oceanicella sp. SM1341]|uniref:5-bromo-4-chloroindolyl phosphate hydrolysis family protein n=1 Tax=Oceanicella sp. SM1341 TaxID=1548889 RepID=UPI000E54E54D|nr:5-bromo-4-chloroindolyl phosphate hydrolysis family protein [Oceanicella sp. SM1341]